MRNEVQAILSRLREVREKVGRFLTKAEEDEQEERVSSLEQEIEALDEAIECLEGIE